MKHLGIQRGILLLILLSLCFLAIVPGAMAAGKKYIQSNNSAPINVRAAGSKSASVVGKLVTGTEVTVLSTEGNWSHIQSGNLDGYVMNVFLKDTDPLKTGSVEKGTFYVQGSRNADVPLLSKASSSSTILTNLPTGTAVTAKSSDGNYTKVTVVSSGKTGYIANANLTANTPTGTNATATTASGTTVYVVSDNGKSVNVRTGAGEEHTVITQVASGTAATLLQSSSNWSRISVSGVTGYVKNEYLSQQNTAAKKSTTKYVASVNSAPVNMRKAKSRTSSVVDQLVTGTAVTVLSSDGTWSEIQVNGKTGYIMNLYLSNDKPGTNLPSGSYKAYVVSGNGGSVRMRYGAGSGYHVVTSLDYGTEVTVLASVQGWARVRSGGYEGYINEDYLTTKKP